jgi:hypothetical protein
MHMQKLVSIQRQLHLYTTLIVALIMSFTVNSYADPFQYNELIDDNPIPINEEFQVTWTEQSNGFAIGSFSGMYLGSASSFLSPEISSLDRGAHVQFGLSIGYRVQGNQRTVYRRQKSVNLSLAKRFEFTLKWALGLGQTYERSQYDNAFDHLLSPLITFHLWESQSWGVASDLGMLLALYDLEDSEVSQITMGSHLGLKFIWKLSEHHHLYISPLWNHIYDLSAYFFREPTEKEREENPKILKFKVKGKWFNLYQVIVGYQLLGF